MNDEKKTPEEKKDPEVKVKAAPRHDVAKIVLKKIKTFDDVEYLAKMRAVKLWSSNILENQVNSPRCPQEFKDECALELKTRKEKKDNKNI